MATEFTPSSARRPAPTINRRRYGAWPPSTETKPLCFPGVPKALSPPRLTSNELYHLAPQIVLSDTNSNRILHPIQSYLDAYDEHSRTLKNEPNNVAARVMLGKLDPPTVKLFQAVKVRAQRFAEAQLKRGMFQNGGNWSLAASELLDTNRWLSHDQMISWEDAAGPPIELHVEYLDPKSDDWQEYWQLYCLQRLAVADRQKLCESDYASLIIDGPA